jgi:hypothetical protein
VGVVPVVDPQPLRAASANNSKNARAVTNARIAWRDRA